MTITYRGPSGNIHDPSAQAAVAQLAAIRARLQPADGATDTDGATTMNDGYFPLPENAKRGTCRSCQQPIAWVQTASGARMPLDLATVEQRDGVTMALNHFATCPQGAAWSKKASAE